MAKDPTQGPITRYDEAGNPFIEPDAEKAQFSTRSEIINEFGEELGGKLLDGHYTSFSGLIGVTADDLAAIDLNEEEIERVMEATTLMADEENVIEEEIEEEVEEKVEEAKKVEEEAEEVPATITFHPHDSPMPLNYGEAQAALEKMSYQELKDLCAADDLKPARSKAHTVALLLAYWYPPAPVAKVESSVDVEMSARVRRIKGLN